MPTGQAFVQELNGVESYHWTEKEELNGSSTTTVYYFWVKNKDTTVKAHMRNLSTLELAKNIINPSFAGIPWCAPLSNGSLLMVGAKEYLNDTTVVQIKRVPRGGKVHHQWMYIADGNQTDTVPEYLHIRLRDSISNSHVELNVINPDTSNEVYTERKVPNVNLHKYNTGGNTIRPYIQSWFKDLYQARRSFLIETNRLLKAINLTSLIDVEQVFGPSVVINDAEFDMSAYWDYTEFVSNEWNATKPISYTVTSLDQVSSLYLNPGEYVRVFNDADNSVYESIDTSGLNLVWKENGTIAFKDITDIEWKRYTWDGSSWDNFDWDDSLSIIFFNILEVLRNDVFVVDHKVNYNKLLCVMFKVSLIDKPLPLNEPLASISPSVITSLTTYKSLCIVISSLTNIEPDVIESVVTIVSTDSTEPDFLKYNLPSKVLIATSPKLIEPVSGTLPGTAERFSIMF